MNYSRDEEPFLAGIHLEAFGVLGLPRLELSEGQKSWQRKELIEFDWRDSILFLFFFSSHSFLSGQLTS